jgi:hypothetical protein
MPNHMQRDMIVGTIEMVPLGSRQLIRLTNQQLFHLCPSRNRTHDPDTVPAFNQ